MSRNAEKFCKWDQENGTQCRAYRMSESDFCVAHDPSTREQQRANLREMSAIGSRRSAEARAKGKLLLRLHKGDRRYLRRVPDLTSVDSFKEFCGELIPLFAEGAIPAERARVVIELLKVLAKTFPEGSSFPVPPLPVDYGDVEPILERPSPLDGMREELSIEDIVREGHGEDDGEEPAAILSGPEVPS